MDKGMYSEAGWQLRERLIALAHGPNSLETFEMRMEKAAAIQRQHADCSRYELYHVLVGSSPEVGTEYISGDFGDAESAILPFIEKLEQDFGLPIVTPEELRSLIPESASPASPTVPPTSDPSPSDPSETQ